MTTAAVPLLLAALVAGPPGAAAAGGPAAESLLVADFNSPASTPAFEARGGAAALAPDPDLLGGTCLRWTLEEGGGEAVLSVGGLPADLSGYGALGVRLRVEGDPGGLPRLRVACTGGDGAEARLPGLGPWWRTVLLDHHRMNARGAYDPRRATAVEIRVRFPRAAVILLDDIVLERVHVPSAGERAREVAPAWTVADFESAASFFEVEGGSAEAVEQEEGGKALLWTPAPGPGTAALHLLDLPRDPTAFRTLRFRVRAGRDIAGGLEVLVGNSPRHALVAPLPRVTRRWATVEIPLPEMVGRGQFDPRRAAVLTFLLTGPPEGALFIDDVVLERAPGGWEYQGRELMERLFGRNRAARGVTASTPHFEIATDSSTAARMLPEALEKAHGFVREALDLPPLEAPLPVYVWQADAAFSGFLVLAHGLERRQADQRGAVGTLRWLAFSYRTPEDRRVVRELARSMFARARGPRGGSWLHAGIGRYAERLWDQGSAAEEYAPVLRSGRHLPLERLLSIPDLEEFDDPRGGAGATRFVTLQAGALVEFLRKGPLREAWPAAEGVLARMDVEDAERPAAVERVLGMPLADLERAWVEWGSRAGKDR